MADARLDELKLKLDRISRKLNDKDTSTSKKPLEPVKNSKPHTKSTVNAPRSSSSSSSALKNPALAQLREAEGQWNAEKGSLNLQIRHERRRAQRAEEELRRAEQQREFHLGAAEHLKRALRQRNDRITELEDQIRQLELGITTAKLSEQMSEENDRLRAEIERLTSQLEHSTLSLATLKSEAASLKQGMADLTSARDTALAQVDSIKSEHGALQKALNKSTQLLSLSSWHMAGRTRAFNDLVALGEELDADCADD